LAENKDVEQDIETFLNELPEGKIFQDFANEKRFDMFYDKAMMSVKTLDDFNKFKAELMPWINRSVEVFSVSRYGFIVARQCKYPLQQFGDELKAYIQSEECALSEQEKKGAIELIDKNVIEFSFYDFVEKSQETVKTPESFAIFKTELKTWINKYDVVQLTSFGCTIAEKNSVSAQEFVDEIKTFVQSSECTLTKVNKRIVLNKLDGVLRTALGSDPKLYGKMLDGNDFNWENLRGKYVLIKFTATWCGPCKGEIPGMLEAYKKYHDKGLEIVSVYIWEGGDAVAVVKKAVEEEKLPWMIISEALTVGEQNKDSAVYSALSTFLKPAVQKQGEYYAINGVPTMLLCDKEGKIIMTEARGEKLQSKLAEIFE
jgi:thiol-disulfide isomerase/thioredoxin